MKRIVATLITALTHVAQAEVIPPPGPADARIRIASYSADEVYRLYGAVGYDLGLEFAPDETFQRVNGGDLQALTYSADGNTFTFKPRVATARMNLTVTTDRHRYYIEYSASDKASESRLREAMYIVRFVYPNSGAPERSPQAEVESRLSKAGNARGLNEDYWFCGHASLKPSAASDDGIHTRLTFPPRAEVPAVFLRNDDGTESLVNFTVEGSDLILHRIAHRWVVRRGRLTGCIVNQSFEGTGARLDSGTVSEDVERFTRSAP